MQCRKVVMSQHAAVGTGRFRRDRFEKLWLRRDVYTFGFLKDGIFTWEFSFRQQAQKEPSAPTTAGAPRRPLSSYLLAGQQGGAHGCSDRLQYCSAQ